MVPRAAPRRWPACVKGCAPRRRRPEAQRGASRRIEAPLQGRRCEGAKPKRLRKAAEKRLCES